MPKVSAGKFVIVGGASLLGSHIGEQLLAGGAREVVLVDNFSLGTPDNIQSLLEDKRCTLVRGDMLRLNELFDPFAGADGVFAVAGFLGMPIAANPWMGLDVNVRGMQNLLEASRIQGVKKVIFSSSVGIYGTVPDSLVEEDSPFSWQTLSPSVLMYGATKIIGEGLGRMYKDKYGVDFLGLRYSSVYGERQHVRAINATRIMEAYASIKAGKRPVLPGNGSQVQDFVYVGDVARANLLGMESSATVEGINIVTGVQTTLNRMVEIINEVCKTDISPEYKDDPSKPVVNASKSLNYSREKAKRLIGWEPLVPVEEGIRRLIQWNERNAAASAR
jgi:UDP-glucose 4-epimerase